MARTKQTARKSTGGKAPRQLLACKSPSQFRQYMTSQQAATFHSPGSQEAKKTSYLNYENVFGSFGFPVGEHIKETFKPNFDAGFSVNPITKENEPWLCMKLKSKYDGAGMESHKRPNLNIVLVIDISGSMGSQMSDDSSGVGLFSGETKLQAAQKCILAILEKFTDMDHFGMIAFDDTTTVIQKLTKWRLVQKDLKKKINGLAPTGLTNLSLAYNKATEMLTNAGGKVNKYSRIIFMTDLNSTLDSVRDEKDLLSRIENNSKINIFTTVVGIGMDFNVSLVEKISCTPGANYISASSGVEFVEVVGKEFNYNVTITAFDIKLELPKRENSFELVKGFGSPEISNLKTKNSFTLSSEFATAQNRDGEITGGVLLFKLKQLKSGTSLQIKLSHYDIYSSTNISSVVNVPLETTITDVALKKVVLLKHFVDLHNDYVMEKKGVKHLERFQSFKKYLLQEMEDVKDNSLAFNNKVYLEMTDKIIDLELQHQKNPSLRESEPATTSSPFMSSVFPALSPSPYGSKQRPKKTIMKKPLKRLTNSNRKIAKPKVTPKKVTSTKATKPILKVTPTKVTKKPAARKSPAKSPKVTFKIEPIKVEPKTEPTSSRRVSTRKRSGPNNTVVVSPVKKAKITVKVNSPRKTITKKATAKVPTKLTGVRKKKKTAKNVRIWVKKGEVVRRR